MRIVTIPKSKIVDAAIKLFSDYGFYGVTYMKLAKEANTTAPSVFRQFKSKPKLFEAALETAVSQSPDAAQFLYMIHEGRRKQALPAKKAIAAAILNWYSSVSPQTARLMCQAYLSKNKKWEEKAFSALYMIIDVLASSVEAESPKTAKHVAAIRASAKALVFALFQFKISATAYSPQERDSKQSDDVELLVHQSLHGMFTFVA